ncbi:MAG: hypothetical protein ACPGSD_12000 [Flavobacteriales bacterium]
MKKILYLFCFIGYFAQSQNIENVKSEYKELTELKELMYHSGGKSLAFRRRL